jgi:hypothetical protein
MASISQSPGTLNIGFIRGDEFSFQLNFGFDLTEYSLSARSIYNNSAGEQAITITPVVLSVGTILLTLTETETLAFPSGQHPWYLKWDAPGNVRRTIISGIVTAG